MYNGLSIFQASKCDQHTHYTHKSWCDLFFRPPTCLHRILVSSTVHTYRISVVSLVVFPFV